MAKRPEVSAVYKGRRLPVYIQTARGTRPARARDAKTIRAAFRSNPSGFPFSGPTWRPVMRLPDGTTIRPRFPITAADRTKKGKLAMRRRLMGCQRKATAPFALVYYRTKKEAMAALEAVNPELTEFLEGAKRQRHEPGLDVIRAALERDKRKQWWFRRAVERMLPARGRWDRIPNIFPILQDALNSNVGWPHGLKLQPPYEALINAEAEAYEAARACARPKRAAKVPF